MLFFPRVAQFRVSSIAQSTIDFNFPFDCSTLSVDLDLYSGVCVHEVLHWIRDFVFEDL